MTQNNQTKTPMPSANSVKNRPNETGSISVQGFLKITDPVTKQVFVEKRA